MDRSQKYYLLFLNLILIGIICWVVYKRSFPEPDNCILSSAQIISKREYCYRDCRYTLILKYKNNQTEVEVNENDYMYKIIGSEIDLLICK